VQESTFDMRFSLADSAAFARLSGDFNPLHVDPVLARRTQFGSSVVHGIHLVLHSLNAACGERVAGGARLSAITCTFHGPVHTDSGVSVKAAYDADGRRIRLVGQSSGRAAFSAVVEFDPAASGGVSRAPDDGEFEPTAPRTRALPRENDAGIVEHRLSVAGLHRLFPALARATDTRWIADLLGTTRIVGMECPGLHSIYAAFKLHATSPDAAVTPALRYAVRKSDARFGMVRMDVAGMALGGSIEAFVRPLPVDQMSLADVIGKVRPRAYEGQNALVIGGSRGIGELTAKMLMAGGADVTITYVRGRGDAERIRDEAQRSGRRCTVIQFDAGAAIAAPVLEAIRQGAFTHAYYFASPHIERNVSGQWDHALFDRFSAVYVHGFAAVCEALLARNGRGAGVTRFFFPSTVFLDHPSKGFAEYCAAKAAGEFVCDYLAECHGAAVARPRMPRMRTDQTSGLQSGETQDAFDIMAALLPEFHDGAVAPAR